MSLIVTNNTMVVEKYQNQDEILYINTDCLGIFKAARDKIHEGHELLTHPLAGSVKPGETPYKTIVLGSKKGNLDMNSLFLIEESIMTCEKLKNSIRKIWDKEILEDFKLIDYSLIFG